MVKIYLDGASLSDMKRLAPEVDGFTTNPSLMKSAGITDYRAFAREVLAIADGKPVSFEVLAEDVCVQDDEADIIAGWGDNVFVKIPIVNSRGESMGQVIEAMAADGIKVNVTAVFTRAQVKIARKALRHQKNAPGIISVFAGRIADTGVDPAPVISSARPWLRGEWQVLWASTREVLNVKHAQDAGADIITVSPALFDKMTALKGRDLDAYSRETVQQFVADAKGITF